MIKIWKISINTCPNMESCNKIHYIPDDGLTGMVFFKSIVTCKSMENF